MSVPIGASQQQRNTLPNTERIPSPAAAPAAQKAATAVATKAITPLRSVHEPDYAYMIEVHHHIENLESFLNTLMDPQKTPIHFQQALQHLEQQDNEVFGLLCYYVYQAFANKFETNSAFGKEVLKNSPLILLQIKSSKNVHLLDQLIAQYKQKSLIQKCINDLNYLKDFLKFSFTPQIDFKTLFDRLDETFIKGPLCFKVWQIDNVNNDPHFGKGDYGYLKILRMPILLSYYKKANLLDDQITALKKLISTFSVSIQFVPSRFPNPTDTFKVIKYYERKYELERLLATLKNPLLNHQDRVDAFHFLDGSLQNTLSYFTWAASICPHQFDFGRKTIEQDPCILLRIQEKADKPHSLNILEQFSEYYLLKAERERQNIQNNNDSYHSLSAIKRIVRDQFSIPTFPCEYTDFRSLISRISPYGIYLHPTVNLVCIEYAHIYFTGGLALATYGIGEALTKHQKVRVILPKLPSLSEKIQQHCVLKQHYKKNGIRYPFELNDGFGPGKVDRVFKLKINDQEIFKKIFKSFNGDCTKIAFYFIEDTPDGKKSISHNDRFKGPIYPSCERLAKERFAFFSKAAANLLALLIKMPSREIVHCHDWHTAAVIPLIKAIDHSIPTVLTLHNTEGQGEYITKEDLDVLQKMGLEARPTNITVKGLLEADEVTVVSKRYVLELQDYLGGRKLDFEIRKIAHIFKKLTGIPNGGNPSVHDPRTDVALQYWRDLRDPTGQTILDLRFSADDPNLIEKREQRAEQLQLFFSIFYPWIAFDCKKIMLLIISRFCSVQKGMHMWKYAIEAARELNCQIIIMGTESDNPNDPAKKILSDLEMQAKEIGSGVLIIRDKKRASDNRLSWQEGSDPIFSSESEEDRFSPPGIGSLVRSLADLGIATPDYEPFGMGPSENKIKGCFPFVRNTGGLSEQIITGGEEMDGFVYDAKLDSHSQEQIDAFKQKLKGSVEYIRELKQDPEAYQRRLQVLIRHGSNSGWTETFKKDEPSPIDQMRYVYVSAIQRAPYAANLSLSLPLKKL